MPRGPRPVPIELTEDERTQLVAWSRRRTSAQGLANRARIVLACAQGANNSQVAAALGVSCPTVRRWRDRFAAERLDGLLDEPRPGPPRTITDEQVFKVMTRTLETTPADATHWSTRSMAAQVGLSQTAVSRIWRAFGLQPHRLRIVQALQGPVVYREGRRCRGPLPGPSRAGGGVVRG